MINPLLVLCRRMALQRGQSRVPTALLPLTKVRSALVYVDAMTLNEDAERACQAVRQFFGDLGIPFQILCSTKQNVNWRGFIKKRVRGTRETRREDLLISLAASPDDFASEYEARCSTARFKVGRFQLPGEVFDLVVAAPENGEPGQLAAFSAIKEYLCKIR